MPAVPVNVGDTSRLSVILLLQSFIAGDYMFILTLSTLVLKGFLARWVIPISHQAPVICQSCLNQSREVYTTVSSSFRLSARSLKGGSVWISFAFMLEILVAACALDMGPREDVRKKTGPLLTGPAACASLYLNPRALWQAAKACLNENL